jgi:hypothetical protein
MTEQHDNLSTAAAATPRALASAESDETTEGGTSTPEESQNGSQGPRAGLVEARDRYRAERDTAREELAAAHARIERLQRAEIERLAADDLSHPSDLFSLSGNDLADYLTESGDVDAEKVAADVAEILAERPGLRKAAPAFDPSQGRGGTSRKAAEPTWGALLS